VRWLFGSNLRIAGVLLLLGGVTTLSLHQAGFAENLYEWAYHHLLSGLDVPEDPSEGTVDAVRLTSLIGGIAELATGAILLLADWLRRRSRREPA
jgi:ABC-type Fe3+ transport system permease subunit